YQEGTTKSANMWIPITTSLASIKTINASIEVIMCQEATFSAPSLLVIDETKMAVISLHTILTTLGSNFFMQELRNLFGAENGHLDNMGRSILDNFMLRLLGLKQIWQRAAFPCKYLGRLTKSEEAFFSAAVSSHNVRFLDLYSMLELIGWSQVAYISFAFFVVGVAAAALLMGAYLKKRKKEGKLMYFRLSLDFCNFGEIEETSYANLFL
ncbi:hypothetical protein ACJX0J_033026, partial [Zea mays]